MAGPKVDFDEYAEGYRSLVSNQLAFFDKENEYFARYKATLARNVLADRKVDVVLDFGCGIGEAIPSLKRCFAGSQIYGYDLSRKSIEIAKERNADVGFFDQDDIGELQGSVDLVFSAGVFHHIEPAARPAALQLIRRLLKHDGKLIVFEHNPFNPVTRRMVNTCPFDADAVLLRPSEWSGMLADAGLLKLDRRYTLFFPSMFAFLRPLERYMAWLPLGGQYCVIAGSART